MNDSLSRHRAQRPAPTRVVAKFRTIVWQAATRDMNPSVPRRFIDEHMAEDPARAQAEYLRNSLRTLALERGCKRPKSALFRDLLPLLNSRHVTLPQHNRLIAQMVGLERRVSRAGKDSITHAPHGQDDLVNAVAGCAAVLHKKFYDPSMGCGDDDDPDGSRAWQAFRLWQHIRRYG
jgi:hypothetical protein